MRAAERGLDGRGLRQLGKHKDRDDWVAAAAFLDRDAARLAGAGGRRPGSHKARAAGAAAAASRDRYAARFDLAPVPAYDYAEIVRIAAALLSREETRQRERRAYDVVL